MVKIKRALISVSDKAGLIDFAKSLVGFGVEIISTGGTAKLLSDNNIPVIEVSSYTGFPEMLDGRVKTLHPKIHGGLLALRKNPEHMQTIKQHNIELIDMVVVNLYPFEKTIEKASTLFHEAIENIDIGGPSMLRSAAKNFESVAVVSSPAWYNDVLLEMKTYNGAVSDDLLRKLGQACFQLTSRYDSAIALYLKNAFLPQEQKSVFPDRLELSFKKVQDLRYGENPHQKASLYQDADRVSGIVASRQLHGKELSFNNILDLNAAYELVKEFKDPAAVIVKHNNPSGVAIAATLKKAFLQAHACDPLSAFGGIIALNQTVDVESAVSIYKSGFVECIIAPRFSKKALEIFKDKKNIRLLELENFVQSNTPDMKRVSGGILLQEKDALTYVQENLKVVTKKKPTKKQIESLLFGWIVSKHVKSNAIVLTDGLRTVGIGAGQMSRVDSVMIATKKAAQKAKRSCLASDAFFPKPDGISQAAKAGITAIIQPGGSIADQEIIAMANKHGIAMVFTGIRHFKH